MNSLLMLMQLLIPVIRVGVLLAASMPMFLIGPGCSSSAIMFWLLGSLFCDRELSELLGIGLDREGEIEVEEKSWESSPEDEDLFKGEANLYELLSLFRSPANTGKSPRQLD
uniref:Uncharacterized protein n=1 Tax=Glossina palpalis gambiensis TaxID=67801 RepID=A0A1B0BCG9_9MUSC